MCGIIGYAGPRDGAAEVIRGLSRLEYRGYDSAGVAAVADDLLTVTRACGRVAALEDKLSTEHPAARIAIGHTRWATHGAPEERNAHPHVDCHGRLAVVHNGIVDNAAELRARLLANGHAINSDTDSECIAHLIEEAFDGDLLAAVMATVDEIEGTYAMAVVAKDQRCIVATRRGSPLIIGLGDGEYLLASDATAMLERTRDVVYLEDSHVALISDEGLEVFDADGQPVPVVPTHIGWSVESASLGRFETFMRKEIDEQPAAAARCLQGRIDATAREVVLPDLEELLDTHGTPRRIVFAACGTSYHAALVAKEDLQRWCGLSVEVQVASELRRGATRLGPGDLLVAVSQSGETADTLACTDIAREAGVPMLAVCNVVGSSLTRAADATLLTHAGPEISVASTKAFVTQVITLRLFAAALAQRMESLAPERLAAEIDALVSLPMKIREVVHSEAAIRSCAEQHSGSRMFAFLGRGHACAVALEGALKLAELSYLPAFGYPAGEIKHGPLAMVDEEVTVVCLATGDEAAKMVSTCEEVRARGARVIAVGPRQDLLQGAEAVLPIPDASSTTEPLLAAVALQLLAYHVARHLGRDIDHPRNLAKSVTVE